MFKATFAAGCFWGVQYYFDQVHGVISSRVGYTGGQIANPSYEDVCHKDTGHTEAVEVTYDPKAVIAGNSKASASSSADEQAEAFRILLRHFFRMHDPTQLNRQGPDVGDQYRSAIFYHSEQEKELAARIKLELQKEIKELIVTQILPATKFYEAEKYHQKYAERTGRGQCHIAYKPLPQQV